MPSFTRDIVVIGASSGGLEPVKRLIANLPSPFPAALLLVMHIRSGSVLPEVLNSVAAMPVAWAGSGMPVLPGTIAIAPPDRHLLLHDNHMLLRRGPRENMARPSIDVLFRSAAASFGGRVIGVLLSGALDDGAAGLGAIRRCGGIGVAQNPEDAAVPEMPLNAIQSGAADYMADADQLAPLLSRLVGQAAAPTQPIPLDVRLESAIAAQEFSDYDRAEKLGRLSPFTCPECQGNLWEIDDGAMLRYRCHVGHAYTANSAQAAQAEEIDRIIERLLCLRQERAALVGRVAAKQRETGNSALADELERRARDYAEDARLMQVLLLGDEADTAIRRERGKTDNEKGST